METKVSVEEKRSFVEWLKKNHKFKNLSALWILEYLIRDDRRASKVAFVNNASKYDHAIMISTQGVTQPFLEYYRKGEVTDQAEQAFSFVRMINIEKFYIQVNFKGKETSEEYINLVEEDPSSFRKEEKDEKIAREFLEEMLREGNETRVRKEIDEALKNREDEKIKELLKLIE